MKNLNIVIWISRGQIINYLFGLCPYACNSSFSVDVKTHQVSGVAPTLFDSHSPLCIIIACGKMDAIQATFPFFSNRSSTIVPLLSILLFERFTILILRATDKVWKQVKQVAWNKTCKNKYISCWMRVIRRGKNLCFFFQHSSNIARRLYLKVSIKIVTTWIISKCHRSLVSFPSSNFWIWRTGENARLNARLVTPLRHVRALHRG